jgi:hypothetical protein
MSGARSRQGSGHAVSEVARSDSSSFVANKSLGSNAAYLLTFRVRSPGRSVSTLLGPGPTSSTAIRSREWKSGASSRESCGRMKRWYVVGPEPRLRMSKPALYCASDNDCVEIDVVARAVCLRVRFNESTVAMSGLKEGVVYLRRSFGRRSGVAGCGLIYE